MHHRPDDQHIVHDHGDTKQIVIARRNVTVEPEVTRPRFLLLAVVHDIQDQFAADVAFAGTLLRMLRQHNVHAGKTLALQIYFPQLSLSPTAPLNTGLPGAWSWRSATK